ncbi:hypothetical protein KPL26_13670 [Clostridium algidicarnis]|uniref:hypothetical protein n=1 Tax=Clostridium algidicarnis TaxID=37659 RepID=UPI001C0E31E6|nr:hypothetical protein [Clostridium algidicarnis]MBU3197677.1 hypothetical protein [Clostridium algidicarnis]
MANFRNTIYLSDELQSYLEEQSEAFGMGKSAYVSMILTMYRNQVNSLEQLAKMDGYMQKIESLLENDK